jgi:hypothetical protein
LGLLVGLLLAVLGLCLAGFGIALILWHRRAPMLRALCSMTATVSC